MSIKVLAVAMDPETPLSVHLTVETKQPLARVSENASEAQMPLGLRTPNCHRANH